MFATIKFLHFFSLMLGATAGFGNMAVALHVKRAGIPAPASLTAMRPFFSKLGLGAVGLIWLTGIALYLMHYTSVDLGIAFHLKLLVAALLFAGVVVINRMGAKAAAAGMPPPPALAKLGLATTALTVIAVALAVYVFS